MDIGIGQKVKFINENLDGVVKSIVSETRLIIDCSDGFDYEVSINEIIIVGENDEHSYTVDVNDFITKLFTNESKQTKEGLLNNYMTTNKYRYEGVLEIDLHLEKLVDFPEKLEDWQRLHTQMQHVKNCLNAAMYKNIKKIIFIHGVGTGVLKTELLNYLYEFENLSVKKADNQEYGAGATEVFIKNS